MFFLNFIQIYFFEYSENFTIFEELLETLDQLIKENVELKLWIFYEKIQPITIE